MSDREKQWADYVAWKKDFKGPIYFHGWDQWILEFGWAVWQASRRAALSETPTPSAIEATAALIANGLVGQASEEDVREVERLILELLGMK
jgi:hypothetical protein